MLVYLWIARGQLILRLLYKSNFLIFSYKIPVYYCKALERKGGQGAGSTWKFSVRMGLWGWELKYTWLSLCAMCVNWLEGHPYTMRTIHSVTVSANSCSCHQPTECLSGFHRIQLKAYFALLHYFICTMSEACKHHSMNLFLSFLNFYSLGFCRNLHFHDH